MENIKAFYIDNFPLQEATKKEDLIFYDFPLLTRYFFQEKNFLFYHVDDDDNLDTYLVFHVEEYILFKLITSKISLRECILNVNGFIYIIDKNSKGEIVKTAYLHSSLIIDDYLPEEDSFIEIEYIKNSFFSNLIEKYCADDYTEKLREKAFYLKIAADPQTKKYGSTLGLDEMVDDILPKITKSYKNYSKSDFENTFKNKITDPKKLNSTYNTIKQLIDYRIVDLKYASFEIGIASDTLMSSSKIEKKELKEWANKIGDNFKEDVLEIDFNNHNELDRISLKFNEDQRKSIYTPILDLANDRNIVFSIKDSKYANYKTIKKPNSETVNRLIPMPKISIELNEKEKELELIQFTGVIEKGKKISSNNYGLFNVSNELHQFITNTIFEKYGYEKILQEEIPITIKKDDKSGKIEMFAKYNNEEFSDFIKDSNFDSAIEKLVKRIYEYYIVEIKN